MEQEREMGKKKKRFLVIEYVYVQTLLDIDKLVSE